MKATRGRICVFLAAALAAVAGAQERTLEPMAEEEWLRNYRTYLERAAAVEETAGAHFELGRWAWDHGLEDEAWEQWIKALTADADHEPTRRATGFVRRKDGWVRPGEVNAGWLQKLRDDGRALTLTVAIQDDASAAFFDEFRWRLRRLNWFLWQITEGQLYLARVEVADRTERGRLIVSAGQLDVPVLAGGGASCYKPGQPDWFVVSGGRCYVRILAHEMMHGLFGLPDERAGCYCLMQGGLYGIRTPDLELCDDDSHRQHPRTPQSCWDLMRARYPQMVHPNPADYGRAPEVEIVVTDN